jgi:hypothetical protein
MKLTQMKYRLKDIALIAEIFGGIAILISLIFVGVQFKENAKATRSATATATIGSMSSWYSNLGNNQQSSQLLWKFLITPDSIPPAKRLQPIFNLHATFLLLQTSYLMVQDGTLDPGIQASLAEAIRGASNQPGMVLYWKLRRPLFIEEFQIYVDDLFQATDKIPENIFDHENTISEDTN